MITVTNEVLINEAQIQPQVFVHRDFHSRNLMVLPPSKEGGRGPGVIDFQDALRGPIGYDLVSLLKDCYISWSRERVERWVKGYRRVLGGLGANVGDSEYQFLRWFDFIGVQRHIKVLGIFARLWHRDGKIGYLDDLPLVMSYVLDACRRYPELVEFGRWLEWRVAPLLSAANAREKERAVREAAASARPKRRTAPKRKAKQKSKPKQKPKPTRKSAPKRKPAPTRKPAPKRKTKSVRRPTPKRRPVVKRGRKPARAVARARKKALVRKRSQAPRKLRPRSARRKPMRRRSSPRKAK